MKAYSEEQVDFLIEELEERINRTLDWLDVVTYDERQEVINDLDEIKREKDFIIKRRFG